MPGGDGDPATLGSVSTLLLQIKRLETYSPDVEFNFSKFSHNQEMP